MILIDTNVAIRTVVKSEELNSICIEACAKLVRDGDVLVVCAQVMAESWSVLTRPASSSGGYGLSPSDADNRLLELASIAEVLPEPPNIWDEHRSLLLANNVSGVNVHDCRLAALCALCGVERILTLNGTHFKRFGIVTVHPKVI